MSELPDIRQIRAFVAVAEEGGFTQAARSLYLTQSAVSHSIKSLEDQLGVKLIDRLGKRIAITRDGLVYLKRCQKVIRELKNASRELDALREWSQGRIRIGATRSMSCYLLPTVLREFKDCFPRCEITVETEDSVKLINLLDQAKIDLAFGIESKRPSWCVFDKLFHDEMGFVMSPMHPWAKGDPIKPDDLSAENFIVYAKASETFRLMKEQLEQSGTRIRATLSLGDIEAIKEMAKLGIGVGIVAPWAARREIESGELAFRTAGDIAIQRDWGVYYHESKELSLTEGTFLGISQTVATEFESYGS